MPPTSTRFLLWPKIQKDGVDTVLEPEILDFRGTPVSITENPSRTARITIEAGDLPIHIGTLVSGRNLYYADAVPIPHTEGTLVNFSHVLNTIYLNPFICPKTGTIDEIVVHRNATGATAIQFRIAAYRSVSATNLAPTGNPVAESAAIAASADSSGNAGARWNFAPVGGITVEKNELIWIGSLSDGTLNVHGHGTDDQICIGWDLAAWNSIPEYTRLSGARTFASGFLSPYDGSLAYQFSTTPIHFIHFSA